MVDAVEDSECDQGLHHIQVELRKADVQVQQSLPKERVKGQLEPLEKVVPVHCDIAGRRPSRLVRWPREPKLHEIRDLISSLIRSISQAIILQGYLSTSNLENGQAASSPPWARSSLPSHFVPRTKSLGRPPMDRL